MRLEKHEIPENLEVASMVVAGEGTGAEGRALVYFKIQSLHADSRVLGKREVVEMWSGC